MAEIVFKCHQTGKRVSGWVADETIQDGQALAYTFVFCTECDQLHLIDRITGQSIHDHDEGCQSSTATFQIASQN